MNLPKLQMDLKKERAKNKNVNGDNGGIVTKVVKRRSILKQNQKKNKKKKRDVCQLTKTNKR